MVNSKKMNKSKVAMIVLAVLLLLSLVLSATGAWFTAEGSYAGESKDDLVIRNGWMTVSIAGDGNSSLYATRAEDDEAIANSEVMPGDWVHISGEKLTVTTTYKSYNEEAGVGAAKVKAHVFVVDANGNEVAYAELTAGATLDYEIPVADLTSANLTPVSGQDGVYLVNEDLTAEDADTVVASMTLGAYTVKAIQVENLTKAEAAAELGITLAA